MDALNVDRNYYHKFNVRRSSPSSSAVKRASGFGALIHWARRGKFVAIIRIYGSDLLKGSFVALLKKNLVESGKIHEKSLE